MKSRPYLLEVQSGGNGADATGVMAFLGFCTYIGLMLYMFMPLIGNIPMFHSNNSALVVTPTVAIVSAYPPGYIGIQNVGGAGVQVVTVTPSPVVLGVSVGNPTPYPTYTPYPTFTPIAYEVSSYKFSFYDPMIGLDKPEIAELNCANWNYETLNCDSALRNGEDFRTNYLRAAACPYDLYIAAAQFEVVSPDWLRALFPYGFVCKDTGELVVYPYIDFLIPWKSMPMPYDKTPWTDPVTLRRLR